MTTRPPGVAPGISRRSRLSGPTPSGHRRAFTYVEVLVVIGILTLVAGILLPVIGRARSAARVAVCSSQLRQIYLAAQTWRQDHGHGPEVPAIPAVGWRTEFRKYLQKPAIYICPEDNIVGGVDAAAGLPPPAPATAQTSPTTPPPPPQGTSAGGSHGLVLEPGWDLDGLKVVVYPKNGPSFEIPVKVGPLARVVGNTPNMDTGSWEKPTSGYMLGFEDGQGAADFGDLVISLANLPHDMVELTVMSKHSDCKFDLVFPPTLEDASYTCPNVGAPRTSYGPGATFDFSGWVPLPPPDPPPGTDATAPGPPTTGTPGFSTDSSYGVNNAADGVYGDLEKVFALDYTTSVADVVDNWLADPYAKEGNLLFARHHGRVNVLFGDGSVRLTDNPKRNLDPAVGQNTTKVWTP